MSKQAETCRCERSTCGCQTNAASRCTCGDDCRCERTCRCGEDTDGGCGCGAKHAR